jgi:hypothetical protein
MLVFIEDGVVKLCLSDRDTGRTAWTSAKCLSDALDTLELQIATDQVEWRSSKPQGKRK